MPRDVTVHAVLPVMDTHILFSEMSIEPPKEDFHALGLAPLAVLPVHQGHGFGSRLVEAGLGRAQALGYGSVFELLGTLNAGNLRSEHTLDELERLEWIGG